MFSRMCTRAPVWTALSGGACWAITTMEATTTMSIGIRTSSTPGILPRVAGSRPPCTGSERRSFATSPQSSSLWTPTRWILTAIRMPTRSTTFVPDPTISHPSPWDATAHRCPAQTPAGSFFDDLWKAQKDWLAKELQASTAEWQIIVTHYPPNFEPCRSTWESYLVEYGVDFYVSGHTHLQHTNTTFGETAFVISGGGGGITSEILPSKTGEDDGYGFMDVVIQHDAMYITRYSHGGVDKKTIVRGVTKVSPRSPKAVSQVAKAEQEVAKVVV
mmetsp:Transcript_66942/g.156996  ORF Transcript_66942/g.156996 Transcript_66942/m.156996 type:complete len:274 (+) Transcript_66942:741-1562(+)